MLSIAPVGYNSFDWCTGILPLITFEGYWWWCLGALVGAVLLERLMGELCDSGIRCMLSVGRVGEVIML